MTGPTVRHGLVERVARAIEPSLWGYAMGYPEHVHSDETLLAARQAALAKATAALAASGIEEMRGALEAAADMCAVYADFIRNHVCADDIEIHPYLPALEDVIANGRAALSLADGMGGEG
jgi:hypothetical protein